MRTFTSPQDGSTLDTFLESDDDTNKSANASLYTGEYTGAVIVARSCIQIPGLTSGKIPKNAIVTSAKWKMKINGDYANNARTVRVYRSKRPIVISQAKWSQYSTGNNWQTAGGFGSNDCEQTDIGSLSLTAGETVGAWKEITLNAAAIQSIISGAWATPTLFIRADTEADDQYGWCSSDDPIQANRPYIVIEYTVPAGFMCWF